MKYIKYLSYVIKHKWFVFLECCRQGEGVRGFFHDMSKFSWQELKAYANFFYGKGSQQQKGYEVKDDPSRKYAQDAFDKAWFHHIHNNPHHWQYWILREDAGKTKILQMPYKYIVEMVCDWAGASRAIRGKCDVVAWYRTQKEKIKINLHTRRLAEAMLSHYPGWQDADYTKE